MWARIVSFVLCAAGLAVLTCGVFLSVRARHCRRQGLILASVDEPRERGLKPRLADTEPGGGGEMDSAAAQGTGYRVQGTGEKDYAAAHPWLMAGLPAAPCFQPDTLPPMTPMTPGGQISTQRPSRIKPSQKRNRSQRFEQLEMSTPRLHQVLGGDLD